MMNRNVEWKTPPVANCPKQARTRWAPVRIEGQLTGALLVVLEDRLVASVPSQLGCPVACRFCVSAATPLVRSLTPYEMHACFEAALGQALPDELTRPVELSFTGEGEPLLNWRACGTLVRQLAETGRLGAVRYSFSGVGAPALLSRCEGAGLPLRLQCSLHCALDTVRSRLVPRSVPVRTLESALLAESHRFDALELNVVLQDGVNDSDEALEALLAFGEPYWPVLLNPLLTPTGAREAVATDRFETALRQRGRVVRRYRLVARDIGSHAIYPLMTARPVVEGQALHLLPAQAC